MDKKCLRIDLTQSKTWIEEIPHHLRKSYIGGVGLNTYYFAQSDALKYEACSSHNRLIFGIGPMVGTGLLAGNRCTVTAKSPMTDRYGDSNIGGGFTYAMASVGYEYIIIDGGCEKPSYLLIDEKGETRILTCHDLWEMDTHQVTDILKARHGTKSRVACIGLAGVNQVRYASIMMEKDHAAGRMGMGAVMGAKNLKAVVIVSGSKKPQIHDIQRFNALKQRWLKEAKKSMISKIGMRYGTLFLIEANNRNGFLPVENFSKNRSDKAEGLYPQVFNAEHKVGNKACIACPLACSKRYEIKSGAYRGLKGARVEFGAASLGPVLGIYDWASVLHLKVLCDKYGMDTIEVGAVISMVIEAYQKNKLAAEKLEGVVGEVEFGSTAFVESVFEAIVQLRGIGSTLAQGVYRASLELGTEAFCFCVNKSSTGLQSSQKLVRSLGYLTSTRGGDHLKSFAFTVQNGGFYLAKYVFGIKHVKKLLDTPVHVGRILWWHENYKAIVDSLGVCLFAIHCLPFVGSAFFDDFSEVMYAIYGISMTKEEVFEAGDRIYQLQNAMNVSLDLSLEHYKWPERAPEAGINPDYLAQTVIDSRDAQGMLPEYFRFRGLDPMGHPTEARFRELHIESEFYERFNLSAYTPPLPLTACTSQVALSIKLGPKDKIKLFIMGNCANFLFKVRDKSFLKKYYQKNDQKKERSV